MTDGTNGGVPLGPPYTSLIWTTADVMRRLHVSRPTAYKLMHGSDALLGGQRHLRVYAPKFIEYLKNTKR